MDLPNSITDLRIAVACRVCNGNGGLGPRTAIRDSDGKTSRFSACTTCNGTGWQLKKPGELTEPEQKRLLSKLPAPADPPIDLAQMSEHLDDYMAWSETWHRQAGGYTASDTAIAIQRMDNWADHLKQLTGKPETSLRRKPIEKVQEDHHPVIPIDPSTGKAYQPDANGKIVIPCRGADLDEERRKYIDGDQLFKKPSSPPSA